VKARLVTKEETDPKTFVTKSGLGAVAVAADGPSRGRHRSDAAGEPDDAGGLEPNGKEQRFDFAFGEFSTDPMPPPWTWPRG
jgi:hypothetical protein